MAGVFRFSIALLVFWLCGSLAWTKDKFNFRQIDIICVMPPTDGRQDKAAPVDLELVRGAVEVELKQRGYSPDTNCGKNSKDRWVLSVVVEEISDESGYGIVSGSLFDKETSISVWTETTRRSYFGVPGFSLTGERDWERLAGGVAVGNVLMLKPVKNLIAVFGKKTGPNAGH